MIFLHHSQNICLLMLICSESRRCKINGPKTQYLSIFCRGLALEEFLQKPNHCFVLDRKDCLAPDTKLLELDIKTLKVSDLEEIPCPFQLELTQPGTLHGFCTWFQVDFQGLGSDKETTCLNTGPDYE